jgi:alpha-D-xyloside xylohydrolase
MPDEHRDNEQSLIDHTMLHAIDKKKAARIVVKQRLRYPRIRGRVGDLEPNVYFGYSDHPLDVAGTPPTTPFTFLMKYRGRKAASVLSVELKERAGNSFLFAAMGYDVFKLINLDTMNRHEYRVTDKSPYEAMTLQIDFLRVDAYRLRLAKGDSVPENRTPMLYADITEPDLVVTAREESDRYIIGTDSIRLEIYKEDFRVEVFDSEGRLVTESGGDTKNEFPTPFDSFPLGFIHDKKSKRDYAVESFVLYPSEAVYGLGESYGPVNRVGRTVGFWNTEGLGNTSGRAYKYVPFFMSTQGYGVFINESRPLTFWVGSRETCKNMFAIEGDLIDYFFFYGPSFKSILDTYTELTGKPPVPPKWTFGTWMSRISYFSQEQVMAVARKLRDMRFPSDVIHIDTGWFDEDWRCDWKFNPERFPDPERMFAEAANMGFRICLWQIPYVLKETNVYRSAKKAGALAKNRGPFVFLMMFEGSPIDFSSSAGVSWYKQRIKSLLEMGAATIKVDFGEGIEPPMRFEYGDGRTMHNLYSLLYQKAAFEAVEEVRGSGQGVIWARSGYAGAQRYPLHWSGDNSSNHENLLSSLRGGLNLGLSGFTFWSQDIGGFVGVPSEELYVRWTQLAVFQSHSRFHGNPPQYKEPWNFKPETQSTVRDYLELRYRLIPYLYTESRLAADSGLPLLRHLAIEFQDDPTVWNIEDQFMCGRNILVAPILSRNDERRVYLPAGRWYDFWTGESHEGGQWITREADLLTIPVYVRAGSILPLAEVAQSTDDLSYDNMTLMVYPDAGGKSGYEIIDGDIRLAMSARLKDDMLVVDVSPEAPNGLKTVLPEGARSSDT